jgi:phosphoribosylcarboxyaminoimidazole (NCAIR) mutase
MKSLQFKPRFGSCLLFITISFFLLLSACGGDGSSSSDSSDHNSSNTGSIAVRAQWPDEAKTIASTDDDYYSRVAPAAVLTVRVIVSGPGMTDMQQDFIASAGSGTVTGVPVGTDRTVTLQGLDSNGTITHEGSVSNITVIAGQTTNAGTVVMKMVIGVFIKTISIAGSWAGFFGSSTYVLAQNLFLASEIDGSGYIDKIYFEYRSTESTAINCPNTTFKLGHTSVANLESTFANNVEQGNGSQVTVINDSTITFPVGVPGDFAVINLDTPFHYNGVDNLVVEMERTAACDGTFDDADHSSGFTSVAWTFTNGSPTGSTGSFRHDMKFTFAGGDNYLDFSTGTLSTGNSYPFNPNASIGRKVQLLYPASDIDGSGPITGIGFPVGATTTNQTYTVTIKLGHSTLSELVDGPFDDSYSDTPVTVASNLTFNVPAGVPQGAVVWLPFTGSFSYNGTDNLILEVETTDNSLATDTTWWWGRFGSGVPYYRLFGDVGSATGTAARNYYFAKFRFYGGTIDVITDGASQTGNIFPPTGMWGRQAMFRSTELGTAGTIEAIACRMDSTGPTVATDYPNYTVIMGHTDLTQLSTTFASNYDDATTVHNGTFSLPAGYIEGDWIEIPITPFAYDGIRNLVVYIYSDGATMYTCKMSGSDLTRYPAQSMATADYTSPTGILWDNKVDMRFKIQVYD